MVIGLGRYGASLALAFENNGRAVFGVDASAERVANIAPMITQAAVADTTEELTLRQLGADDFSMVMVAIGGDLEASILTTSALADLGVPEIWARAVSDAHQRVLERVGAHRVIQPLREMGRRVARLAIGNLLEFVDLSDDLSIAEIQAPSVIAGRTLGELGLRTRYDVTIVAVKASGAAFTPATPHTTVATGDLLVLTGTMKAIEAFAALP